MKIFDQTMEGIQRAMDIQFRRHAVLTSNVANAETPNYRAREVDFAGELQRAFGTNEATVNKTDARHLDLAETSMSHVTFDNSGAMGADGNNVDLDLTMGKISSNGRAYDSAANLLGQKFKMLRTFVRKGGY